MPYSSEIKSLPSTICLAVLLQLSPLLQAVETASGPYETKHTPIERAISRVYPALVQIQVVALDHQRGREQKYEAVGSGVIISPEGYVVTNHHVASKSTAIRCVLSNKEELHAKLVGTDALSDIAVLKLDLTSRPKNSPPLSTAQFGNSASLNVGDTVLAMGCPRALSQSVTQGIVANKDMILPKSMRSGFLLDREDVGSLVKWIGHDAQIQPGNSGGPLVNLDGEIVGINEIGVGSMSGAIPSDLAKGIVQELMAHEKVRRSWIGANFQPLLKTDLPYDGKATAGILVAGVISGAPAEAAGLHQGDIVMEVDGVPVKAQFREELPVFNMLLFSKSTGKPIQLKVHRNGKVMTLSIQAEIRDNAEGKEVEAREWGLVVEELTTMSAKELYRPDKKGILVSSVRPGGPADKAAPAIADDDIIVEIAGKPVESKKSFFEITSQITEKKTEPVPTIVAFERESERLLTLVEVGIRTPRDPTEEARKAWLPVTVQVLSQKLAKALGLQGKKGVRISQVYPESSAVEAGFRVGDILTHIDAQPIDASEDKDPDVFEAMIRNYKTGSKAEFDVIRDGKPMKITALLVEQPKPEKQLKIYEDVKLEFKARDISYFDRVRHHLERNAIGALVTQVERGGWADVGDLRVGDFIQEVNGQKIDDVKTLETFLKALHDKQSKYIVLFVRRGIHTLFLELEPIPAEKG